MINVMTTHQLASSLWPRFFSNALFTVVATAATIARNTIAKAMVPRLAHPNTVFGVKESKISVAGAIEGRNKCLKNLFLDSKGCPIFTVCVRCCLTSCLYAYISASRPRCFNAVSLRIDLPNARVKLRAERACFSPACNRKSVNAKEPSASTGSWATSSYLLNRSTHQNASRTDTSLLIGLRPDGITQDRKEIPPLFGGKSA